MPSTFGNIEDKDKKSISRVVLHICETRYLTLRKKLELQVLKNVFRKIFWM